MGLDRGVRRSRTGMAKQMTAAKANKLIDADITDVDVKLHKIARGSEKIKETWVWHRVFCVWGGACKHTPYTGLDVGFVILRG